jgi:predicted adenylyl cyclase CyaB
LVGQTATISVISLPEGICQPAGRFAGERQKCRPLATERNGKVKKYGYKALLLVILQSAFASFVSRKVNKAHLEVERKFSITDRESESLPLQLRELGFKPAGSVVMTDTFLPARDQGEMMRIRDEVAGSRVRSVFTLKSWLHTADGGKERQESEAEVSQLLRTVAIILARYVCGKEVLSFSKERTHFEGHLNGSEFVACLDRVSGLGRFSGNFLEVETIVPLGADPGQARTEIFKLVEKLFGTPREDLKMSYLEMLKLSRQL